MNNNEMKNLKETLVAGIKDWFERTNGKVAVIGISGGKDSTCVAALCVEALGVENVIGVSMPNGVQSDMDDVNRVFDLLKIKRVKVKLNKIKKNSKPKEDHQIPGRIISVEISEELNKALTNRAKTCNITKSELIRQILKTELNS